GRRTRPPRSSARPTPAPRSSRAPRRTPRRASTGWATGRSSCAPPTRPATSRSGPATASTRGSRRPPPRPRRRRPRADRGRGRPRRGRRPSTAACWTSASRSGPSTGQARQDRAAVRRHVPPELPGPRRAARRQGPPRPDDHAGQRDAQADHGGEARAEEGHARLVADVHRTGARQHDDAATARHPL
ncbi:MAG: hypothetical protein AVDCRST_MAG85-2293, partial [uncultured Solirubrobacteraceae bacterium]